MKKIFILSILLVVILIGCVSKQRENELLSTISRLESQLDECQNGADKLYAKMKAFYEKSNFQMCKGTFLEMEKRYPESELLPEMKSIYNKIIKEEAIIAEREKAKIEKEKKEKLAALNKLRKRYDDVSGVTWYEQPYFTHYTNTNLTSIYLGVSGSSKWLRLRMSYQGDDWIFFKNAYLSYDGNTKEILFNEYDDKESDNGTGGVWEWIDLTVTSDVEEFLREFAKSSNAKMRLSGKYTKTRNLSKNERQGIIDVLNGYDLLKQDL